MRVEISYRKGRLYMAIFAHFVCLWSLIVMLYALLHPEKQRHHVNGILIASVILFALLCNVWLFITSLYIPTGVNLHSDTKPIVVKFWLLNPRLISVDEISSYYSTLIVVKGSKYAGVLVHLNNGEKVLFSEWNLTEYKPVQEFLDGCGIKNLGKEDFSIFSYCTQYFNKK